MANLSTFDVPPARPLFIVRDGADRPLVFLVDEAGRLQLLRNLGDDTWTIADLSGALPGRIRCADVRQAPDGAICVAIVLAGADERCAVHVASGLPAGLDDAGWLAVLRELAPLDDVPPSAQVQHVAFGPLQAGAPPLLLIAATLGGKPATWYCNAASLPCGIRRLAVPAGVAGAHVYAVGTYRLPGVWALHPGGRDGELRFTSFGDAFGWKVDVDYPNLPPGTASVRLAPGLVPNVPDVYAAGERIVVYRGSNPIPQLVAQVPGARLLWSALTEGGEYLAYADAAGALWLVTRPARGAWGTPFLLTRRRAVLMAAADGTVYAAAFGEDGMLSTLRCDGFGKPLGASTVHLPLA